MEVKFDCSKPFTRQLEVILLSSECIRLNFDRLRFNDVKLRLEQYFSKVVSVDYLCSCRLKNNETHQVLKESNITSNKTGTRQCSWAVWSTFAEIHSTHPNALMHYLGLLEFPVRICDASHIKKHTRPT